MLTGSQHYWRSIVIAPLSFILSLSMGSKCLIAWGLRSKTWGLSDLDPNLISNQIREFLKLESNK